MINLEKIVIDKIVKLFKNDPEKIFDFINSKISNSSKINIDEIVNEIFKLKEIYYEDKYPYSFRSHTLHQKKILMEFIKNEKELSNFKKTFIDKLPTGTFLTWDQENSNEVIFKIFYSEKNKMADFGGKIVALKEIPIQSLVLLEESVKIYA